MTDTDEPLTARAQALERWLLTEFGPVLSGQPLRKLLGYRTPDAFRQALRRHGAPVKLFQEQGRKGWCASTRDLARWIAHTEAAAASTPSPSPSLGEEPMS